MKTQFTTGKWHFRTGMSDNHSEVIGDIGTNKVIAVTPKDCFVSKTEAEANGKLIAAAPDLLRVCIEAKTIIYNLYNRLYEERTETEIQAIFDYAIKKATE